MRIVKLTTETTKNLLDELLQRSPNSYGEYESRVNEIIEMSVPNGTRQFLHTQNNLTAQTSTLKIFL